MKTSWYFEPFPPTRLATFDTFAVALKRHHVAAVLEFDVTDSRKKLQQLRREGTNISFNAWLIKVISNVLDTHREAAAFRYGKRKLILFNSINVSVMVEKEIDGKKVPVPMVIENAEKKTAQEITAEITVAKNEESGKGTVVLNRKTSVAERVYYLFPGFVRRFTWKVLLRFPKLVYPKMGNVMVTSVGMAGRINGWFIHRSVHPVSFGVGSVLKKPVVVNDEIRIREILNMTILIDHDVIDGAPMVRLLHDLTLSIERGDYIS